MRLKTMILFRRFFHREDLAYGLDIYIQGSEEELKALQKKIMELIP